MRFVTSCFNATLYRKHLARYWPIAAVWFMGWVLAFPVSLWVEQDTGSSYLAELVRMYPGGLPTASWLIAGLAIITAVAVLFHLFRSPAAGFVGALPVRRECVFTTAFLAGYTLMTAPLILVSGITWLVELALDIAHPAIFHFLGGAMLLSFFWLSFAFLCCIITGNGVAAVAFYGIFNGVAIIMLALVEGMLELFLYGFAGFPKVVDQAVTWLTPLLYLGTNFHPETIHPMYGVVTSYWELALVYAGVGFLMFLAGLGLHHIRKAERAGDLIAFRPLRTVFLVCVTVCGGLAVGILITLMIFHDVGSAWQLAGGCAFAAALSWFVAQMLLRKTLRVFKDTWKGALIAAAAFVLVILAIDLDFIGYTRRVPDPAQVKWAEVVYVGGVDPIADGGLTYTGEEVKAVVDLHQYLVDHREEKDYGDRYVTMEVTYHTALTSFSRQYRFCYGSRGEWKDRLEKAVAEGTPALDLSWQGRVGMVEVVGDTGSAMLDGEASQAVLDAVREDLEAGRYRAHLHAYAEEIRYSPCLYLWENSGGGLKEHQTVYLRPEFTSTWAAVEKLGLVNEMGQSLLERWEEP